ncbi:hypothetical protein [Vibrio aestuarianus]|uniref:hypothetical protein n=1 Tax=Vibrio aestuarianus TaxID=28171 RepID=UPI00249B1B03|nr:hypothetical protein [Vibrio aestuarianus]WDS55450.1 hypothetical protein MCL29_06830 [Vibrio aestuarianus]
MKLNETQIDGLLDDLEKLVYTERTCTEIEELSICVSDCVQSIYYTFMYNESLTDQQKEEIKNRFKSYDI